MCRLNEPDVERYCFRGLDPDVLMGTASDRYAGWIGQIYAEETYRDRITHRTHKIGGKSFTETVLPVDSVREYFAHFPVLEIDYTFYQPLLDRDGTPTQSFHVLKSYREHMTAGDSLILKVPQMIFAQKIRRGNHYVPNESYLNPRIFTHQFYVPASHLLGSHLKGFIFEQEYQRNEERLPTAELAAALDRFFEAIPGDRRYHIELRTETYLDEAIFTVFERFGIGQVLSHWTWLPSLQTQFRKSGGRFFNSGRQAIIRLMTPRGTRYEEAYAQAFPFSQLVEGMLQSRMVDETVALMKEGTRQKVLMHVIINNRAGGNAPRIAQLVAERFLSKEAAAID
jgi:uncharacterized protein YecE (DUF72 family)